MKEELVEIIEIWRPVEKGGQAYDVKNKKNLEIVAYIANGKPVFLKEDFLIEVSYMRKEELPNI